MNFTAIASESKRGETVFEIQMQKENGEMVINKVDLSTFLNILDATKVQEENYVRLSRELVPEGYIDGAFASDDTYWCIWKVKGAKRQFVLDMRNGDDSLRHHIIPYPSLVFALKVHKGVRQAFRCYATKEGSSALYEYPFGNVNTGGSVCMGSIRTKDVTPANTEEDFFLGVTNNDYYSGFAKCGMDWSQEKLIKELSGKDEFPDNWLQECGQCRDVKELIKNFAA